MHETKLPPSRRPSQTKIVATVGPAFQSLESLVELIQTGVDVFRVNTAHGTREEHQGRVDAIREAARRVGQPVAILADLAGPMLVVLLCQALFLSVVTYFLVFRLLGKNYDAAVMSSGLIGHGLGATPTAIVNMTALTERYGPAERAFLVVPITGTFLIDLFNAINITVFLNLFAR